MGRNGLPSEDMGLLPHPSKPWPQQEAKMPVLVPFLLLFVMLGLLWVVAAGLLVGTLIVHAPRVLEKMLDHKGDTAPATWG